jgi:hypothetical protein
MVPSLASILAACCLAPAAVPPSLPAVNATVPAAALGDPPARLFKDISVSSGINLRGRGRGSAWGDIDDDGLMDLGVGIQEDGFHLFKNLGNLQFREITLEAGITTRAGTNFGVTFADADNDKDLDLFLCFGGYQNVNRHPQPNRLYENDGTGHFTEIPDAAGMALPGYSFSASWSDINDDGWLDVFICRVHPDETTGDNRLFLNRGNWQFEDVTDAAGVRTTAFSQQAIFFDMDQDGDPDLFFTNRHAQLLAASVAGFHHDAGRLLVDDTQPPTCGCSDGGCRCGLPAGAPPRLVCPCGPAVHAAGRAAGGYTVGSRLFRNDGTGRFTDISDEAGVSGSQGTFPAATADYDNDGDMDLFVGTFNYGPREAYFPGFPDRLYRNEGNGKLTEVAEAAGVADFGGPMGCTFIDLDNDGWIDLYTARGGPEPNRYEYDRVYRNNRDGTFTEAARSLGLVNAGAGHGATAADADGDGDLDLYIPNGGMVPERVAQQLLFENTGNPNSWIQVRPQGLHGNRDAVNAVLTLSAGPMHRYHEITAGTAFGSMTPMNAFFGLADHESVDRLTITWRGGLTRTVESIPARRAVTALVPIDFAADPPLVAATGTAAAGRAVRLSWADTREPGVGRYRVTVTPPGGEPLVTVVELPELVTTLKANQYTWSVDLEDDLGRAAGAIDPQSFTVPLDAPPPPVAWSAAPNPFVQDVVFAGPATENARIRIHDVRGRVVRTLTGNGADGALSVAWDGRDDAGRPVSAGIYLARVEAANGTASMKVVRLEGNTN